MKVILIGASGVIGKEVAKAVSGKFGLVEVSRKSGQHQADITSADTIEGVFAAQAPFDAVVCCAGSAAFKPLLELTDEDFKFSLDSKLMGQVNVVRAAAKHISEGGSITLTSGVLASQPMPGSAAVSLVNAGLEGFARAAALELAERKIRVNVVSPPWVTETLIAFGMDPSQGMPAAQVAKAYLRSLEETELTGQIISP